MLGDLENMELNLCLQVGDGTTSVVLLAGELLKEVKGYIEDGVSPHVIIKGYRTAAKLVRALRNKSRLVVALTKSCYTTGNR